MTRLTVAEIDKLITEVRRDYYGSDGDSEKRAAAKKLQDAILEAQGEAAESEELRAAIARQSAEKIALEVQLAEAKERLKQYTVLPQPAQLPPGWAIPTVPPGAYPVGDFPPFGGGVTSAGSQPGTLYNDTEPDKP